MADKIKMKLTMTFKDKSEESHITTNFEVFPFHHSGRLYVDLKDNKRTFTCLSIRVEQVEE